MARKICIRNFAFASVMIFFVCTRGKAEGRADKQAKKTTTMFDTPEPTSSMIPSDMPSLVPSRRPSSSSQPSTIYDYFFETDMDDEPEDEEGGHQFVVRPFVPNENNIRIVGTVATMAEARYVEIDLPPPTQPGDLLVMFLHRTDDYLPFLLGGSWERVAWCFKGNNHYNCATECIQLLDAVGNNGERYCEKFLHPGRRGEPPTEVDKHNPISAQDLSQVVFVREYTQYMVDPESRSIEVDFFGSSRHPSWIVLVVLRGASTIHPIRDWSATGADLSNHSVFPHVEGEPNDIIFLSQSFDDRVGCQNRLGENFSLDAASLSGRSSQGSTSGNPQCQGSFLNPNGTQLVGYVAMEGMDATAFLWGGTLLQHVDHSNPPIWRTEGPGKGGNPWGPPVKDLMISMTVRP